MRDSKSKSKTSKGNNRKRKAEGLSDGSAATARGEKSSKKVITAAAAAATASAEVPAQSPAGQHKRRRVEGQEAAWCETALDSIMSHPLALPFIEPIERASLPQYFKVIKRPMSFLTVKKKLERRLYASKDSFIDDIRLVFRNCQKFNDVGSKLYKDSVEIGKFVDSLLQPTARAARECKRGRAICALVLHHVRMHEDAGPFSDPRPLSRSITR